MSDAQMPNYLWTPHGPGFVSQAEHTLRVSAWSAVAGVTLSIAAVVLGDDGCPRPTLYTVVPTSDRLKTSPLPFALEKGQLSSLHVFASAGTPIGSQCFVRVELIQGREGGTTSLGTIVQGYVTANSVVAYPGDNTSRSVDGHGTWRIVPGTVPAAGADFSDTVPVNTRWSLAAIAFTYVTDATAPVRTLILTIDDGANVIWETSQNGTIAASLTTKIRAGAGVQNFGPVANTFILPLPETLLLPAGSRIRSVTTAKGAADQFSAIFYNVEEFLDV